MAKTGAAEGHRAPGSVEVSDPRPLASTLHIVLDRAWREGEIETDYQWLESARSLARAVRGGSDGRRGNALTPVHVQ